MGLGFSKQNSKQKPAQKSKRNKKNQAKIVVNSSACALDAASGQWRCVRKSASTVNNIDNIFDYDNFWVNSLNNNTVTKKKQASKK
jgi:hypothetical protein